MILPSEYESMLLEAEGIIEKQKADIERMHLIEKGDRESVLMYSREMQHWKDECKRLRELLLQCRGFLMDHGYAVMMRDKINAECSPPNTSICGHPPLADSTDSGLLRDGSKP